MMEHDFVNYAKTLSIEEIDNFISKLNQVKENRVGETRRAAAQKVKDAIDEYLKLGEVISINGEVWDADWHCHENVEATFVSCYIDDVGRLTFFVE